MPNKCKKCTVDCVVLVEPDFDAIVRMAANKLRLKINDLSRLQLSPRNASGGFPAGYMLPNSGDLSAYLCNDAVVAVTVTPTIYPDHQGPTPLYHLNARNYATR